jgi:hypothetical protein
MVCASDAELVEFDERAQVRAAGVPDARQFTRDACDDGLSGELIELRRQRVDARRPTLEFVFGRIGGMRMICGSG